MKVFVSIDLEGISGVFREAQTDELGSAEHRAACELMRGDLDAALAGCADAGVAEVVVCDAHYESTNLGVEGLADNVTLISGTTADLSMMEGIDASFDAALLRRLPRQGGDAGRRPRAHVHRHHQRRDGDVAARRSRRADRADDGLRHRRVRPLRRGRRRLRRARSSSPRATTSSTVEARALLPGRRDRRHQDRHRALGCTAASARGRPRGHPRGRRAGARRRAATAPRACRRLSTGTAASCASPSPARPTPTTPPAVRRSRACDGTTIEIAARRLPHDLAHLRRGGQPGARVAVRRDALRSAARARVAAAHPRLRRPDEAAVPAVGAAEQLVEHVGAAVVGRASPAA